MVKILSWNVGEIDRGFTTLKSDFYNVNLPAYTLVPAALDTIIYDINKARYKPISTIFQALPYKFTNNPISSQKQA